MNICNECNGRGYHWDKQRLLKSRATGEVLADLYEKGDTCTSCNGFGLTKTELSLTGWVVCIGIGFGIALFVLCNI